MRAWGWIVTCWGAVLLCDPADGQLLTNLQGLVSLLPTGDRGTAKATDGPKGIATADLDNDGHADLVISDTAGTVTVYFGRTNAQFERAVILSTGAETLRGIACADWNGDRLADIAAAAPYEGTIYVFFSQSFRTFTEPVPLAAWSGVRNLAAGDFDGDGTNDLAAAGRGVGLRQYRGVGGGAFAVVTSLPVLAQSGDEPGDFPRPVYSLRTVRPWGGTRDQLVLTHADATNVWVLAAGESGALHVVSTLANRALAHSLAVGPIFQPANSPTNDLVVVQRDGGTIQILAGTNTSLGFKPVAQQVVRDLDRPRAVEIMDLDQDGWNDLVVVLRDLDTVVTLANSNGVLRLASERPVGLSPREVVAADFDQDGFPDAAVLNRRSSDVSVLITFPQRVGFTALDHLYLVDGTVAGLSVVDFNRDGRDDVIQLHRASGDFSVWLAQPGGTLAAPVYYTVGHVPASQVLVDVNNDRLPDMVAANLETFSLERSSVSVRLGSGDGTFGAERRFVLPDTVEGRLFALVPIDLDRDGNIDLAAGFLDSRVAFFRGGGDGSFTFTRIHEFVYQARGMVAGDFDQDGDPDLAGVGVSGELWVVENQGHLLTTTILTRKTFPSADPSGLTVTIKAVDLNKDSDLDLIVGASQGAFIYTGKPGLDFAAPEQLPTTNAFPVSDSVLADFDGDQKEDLIVAGRLLDSLVVYTLGPQGEYRPALTLDVPASRFVASGDIDGDGLPDLVGSGRILWTALSSRRAQRTPPLARGDGRPSLQQPVINEFLAINTQLPEDSDGDRLVDWIELYNAGPVSFSLHGWRLRVLGREESGADPGANDFVFPPTAFFGRGRHLLVYCSTEIRTAYHTGWKIPGGGGAICLLDPAGQEVDRVEYPVQQENVSFARFRDGVHAFVFSSLPSPKRPNPTFASTPPSVRFEGVEPASFQPGSQPIRFLARALDDVGIASLRLFYQRLDEPNQPVRNILFHDDGLHGDGAVSDDRFAGDLLGGLPAGAELQFFLEVIDLNDQVSTLPEAPEFGLPGQPGNAFGLGLGWPSPGLELSELVALNEHGLLDDGNPPGRPDWVEVRNVSDAPVSLTNVSLAKQIGESSSYQFPPGTTLQPGEYFVVFCDDNPAQGDRHAPFSLGRLGDQVMLTGLTTNGSRTLLDWVSYDQLGEDQALARLGRAGGWRKIAPTPMQPNVPGVWLGFVQTNSAGPAFTVVLPNAAGSISTLDYAPALFPPQWTRWGMFQGDGIERVFKLPWADQGYLRVMVEH